MKMRFVFAVIFAFGISLPTFAQSTDTETITKFIASQAARERGEEYPDARKIVEGDLNRDGTSDVVALYTIEGQNGTNNHVQYLAAFLRTKGQLVATAHASVGGKNYRDVELESIKDGTIQLTTLNYARNDPACCPSKKGSTKYVLANGKLREVRKRG